MIITKEEQPIAGGGITTQYGLLQDTLYGYYDLQDDKTAVIHLRLCILCDTSVTEDIGWKSTIEIYKPPYSSSDIILNSGLVDSGLVTENVEKQIWSGEYTVSDDTEMLCKIAFGIPGNTFETYPKFKVNNSAFPPTKKCLYGSNQQNKTEPIAKLYGSWNGVCFSIFKLYGSSNGRTTRIF